MGCVICSRLLQDSPMEEGIHKLTNQLTGRTKAAGWRALAQPMAIYLLLRTQAVSIAQHWPISSLSKRMQPLIFVLPSLLAFFMNRSLAAITCLKPGSTATAKWANASGKSCSWTWTVGSNFGTNSVNGGGWVDSIHHRRNGFSAKRHIWYTAIAAMVDAGQDAPALP